MAAIDPRTGGRSLLGGLVFGCIGAEIGKRAFGLRCSTGDLFALALPAGEAVGRLGCYLNGCCYGTKCDLPWAVWQHGAWRHPAQIYSSAVAAAIFGILLWLRPRLKREGDLFRAYLFLFGLTRFALEFVRWRETLWFGLSPMQWFCLELVGGVFLLEIWRRPRNSTPPEGQLST
jgi:phosphatidylglycerol:prolipoprotein diacylglycerol transferase